MTSRLTIGLTSASIALSLLLVGCSSSPMTPGMGTSGDVAVVEGAESATSGLMSVDGKTAVGGADSAVVDRSTIETAYLSVRVPTPQSSATDAQRIVDEAGGFIQDSSWNPANEFGPESAYLTIRVPVDQLDTVLTALESLGSVDSLSRSQTDVTLTLTDLNARVASLQQSLDNLRTLQAQASTVADLITVESAIAARQSELDSLVAQQTYLTDQVDMSTISLSLVGSTGTTPTNDTFWDGLVAGWNSLAIAGSALLVAAGFLIPWIVLLAVIAGVVLVIVFTVIRRRRASATATNGTGTAQRTPSSTKK